MHLTTLKLQILVKRVHKEIQKARHQLGENIYNDTTGGVEYRTYKEFL